MYARSDAYYIIRADCHMREQLPVSFDRMESAIADANQLQRECNARGNDHHAQYSVESREGIVHVTAPCCDLAGKLLPGYTRPSRPAFSVVHFSVGE